MHRDFWLEKWDRNEIGFHEEVVNPLLCRHIDQLPLTEGGRMFVPLCGKTMDIGWLLARGQRVVGCELSHVAVTDLFAGLGLTPNMETTEDYLHFTADNLDIFVGDLFDLTSADLGHVDAVYDRAALVALPEQTRTLYVPHILSLSQSAPQLLVTLDYDQREMKGPPFSISDDEVRSRYASASAIRQLSCDSVPGGLKGRCEALEKAWLIRP